MYEFQLTDRLNRAVQELCLRYSLQKVNRIMIRVGGFRRINPELMAFIFSSVSRGTPAEGANLSVLLTPAALRCYDCGRTWTTMEDAEFRCPYCMGRNVDVVSGFELKIDYLEVEQ